MTGDERFRAALRGELLWGDDFGAEELAAWHADEAEGYSSLKAAEPSKYRYVYHALNRRHAFRFIRGRSFAHALGLGSAYGHEFLPIQAQLQRVTIVESSQELRSHTLLDVPVEYVAPAADGQLSFDDNLFDLATCFGVLHHIPNVSRVVGELARVVRPGGVLLLREPIVSMGDWRKSRRGLTKRERGIPSHILQKIVTEAGFEIRRASYCVFPITPLLGRVTHCDAYGSGILTRLDELLSKMFAWNDVYHAEQLVRRLRPNSLFVVADRR